MLPRFLRIREPWKRMHRRCKRKVASGKRCARPLGKRQLSLAPCKGDRLPHVTLIISNSSKLQHLDILFFKCLVPMMCLLMENVLPHLFDM